LTLPIHAGSFKKYAGEFLYLGAGGRAQGMAGAYTAVSNDVTAGYWNPAGLTGSQGFQLQFMHSKQFISSIQYNYLAASHPLHNGATLGFSFLYLTINDIKDSRNAYDEVLQRVDPSRIEMFNTGDYSFLISYARKMNDKLSWGVNVKTIYRDYEVESGMGFGFDGGIRYSYLKNLHLGLMVHDITTTMISWSTGENEFITPSVRTGVAYDLHLSSLNLRILPSFDFNILLENREFAGQFNLGPLSLDTIWGMEVAYNDLIGLRLGYDDLERFSTGIGIKIPKIAFDYAFTEYESELGNLHRISFHISLSELW
jgi:hypothetical protein